jgi:hypothetical protein
MRFSTPKAEFKRDFLTVSDNSSKVNIFLIFCLSASLGLRVRTVEQLGEQTGAPLHQPRWCRDEVAA